MYPVTTDSFFLFFLFFYEMSSEERAEIDDDSSFYFFFTVLLSTFNYILQCLLMNVAGGVKLLDIPLYYTQDQLQHFFKSFGTIARIVKQQRQETASGYIFVYFQSDKSAQDLLQYTAIVWII